MNQKENSAKVVESRHFDSKGGLGMSPPVFQLVASSKEDIPGPCHAGKSTTQFSKDRDFQILSWLDKETDYGEIKDGCETVADRVVRELGGGT